MTPKEALKTKYVGSGDNGEMLLAYTGEQVEIFKNAFTELEEMKREHTLTIKLFNSANEKLNSLERDVKRYFELVSNILDLSQNGIEEYRVVSHRLKKVGKEE